VIRPLMLTNNWRFTCRCSPGCRTMLDKLRDPG
jgi:hypothetical protein